MTAFLRRTIFAVIVLGGIFLPACEMGGSDLPPPAPNLPADSFQTTPPTSPAFESFPSDAAEPVPTATTPACLSRGGEIVDGTIPTKFIPRPLEYRIYLPPCYYEYAEMRYPVLYLIHGQNFAQDQWDRIGADEVVDALVAVGEIAPFIIVMPRERIWQEPPEDQFGESLMTELLPWVDANYRTLPDRGFRAIGGLSRGAAWAVHIGLQYWEQFGAIGAHSPALFWADTAELPKWLEGIPRDSLPRIFIDVGRRDFQQIQHSAEWFGALLDEMGIPHEWYSFAGRHDEHYWHSHVDQYVRFYAREW